jgi:hypothetical protein
MQTIARLFQSNRAATAAEVARRSRRATIAALAGLVGGLSLLPLSGFGAEPDSGSSPAGRLNDTGQTLCVNWVGKQYRLTPECKGTWQDGEFGRDARFPSDANGHAGFSFVKIGSHGEALPPDAPAWDCVRDRVTGLTWENKTHDGGLHDVNALFTNQRNGQIGDASAFVAAVNAAGWCGVSDWQLPSRPDLESLVDFSVAEGGPMIDTHWFPDTAAALHWTASSSAKNGGGPDYWWAVNYYGGTSIWYGGEYGQFAVRLVRRHKPPQGVRWATQGGEVLDNFTHLVWRRCTEGQTWTGATCSGAAAVFLTASDAMDHAKAEATAARKPWRAPNVKELSSLVDTRTQHPFVDPVIFPRFPGGVLHTGTPWTENQAYSWRVAFYDGGVRLDFWGGSLLLVRDAD